MANKHIKNKPLSLIQQRIAIQQQYNSVIESISTDNKTLKCILKLQPSCESRLYKIMISYKLSEGFPKVWLLSPELEKYNGKYPHHIYEFDSMNHPRLCVYFPAFREWRSTNLIAFTFIPWVLTWLSTYEYWLITGEWFYDESPVIKKEK